jgi:cell division septation protein DedD
MPALENVFWLGGSPCAGKSSISTVLANRFDLDLYRVDEAFDEHVPRLDAEIQPALVKWCAASWNERWMRPPESLVSEVIACYREHFSMILEDVASLPRQKPLLVEGSALLPREVFGVSASRRRAVWIVPTAAFQRENYRKREWVSGIVEQCDDAEAAFQNWMQRDIQFARWIAAEADALGGELLVVDGQQTIEENARQIAAHFGLEANLQNERAEIEKQKLKNENEKPDSKSNESPAVNTVDSSKPAGGNWFVILGSFPKNERWKADERLQSVRDAGYNADIVDTDNYPGFRGGLWSVVIGPYSKSDARSWLPRIKSVRSDAYIKPGW